MAADSADTVSYVASQSVAPGLVAVHVGEQQPKNGPAIPERAASDPRFARPSTISTFADSSIDWPGLGMQPRWLEQETSDCAAALDPGAFHNNGVKEFERFLAGTQQRSETALVVCVLGDPDLEARFSPFGSQDATVLLPGLDGQFAGERLPAGTRPSLAPEVADADKNLGLRLLNRPDDASWWRVEIRGLIMTSPGGHQEHLDPGGRLHPILVDPLGSPVVAVWIPDAGDQRWYVVPGGVDPATVLDWLISQALPEHVPTALRRVRAPTALDPALQTTAETAARRALSAVEEEYNTKRQEVSERLRRAKENADPLRHGLLYGTGTELEEAVARALRDAGMTAVSLDDELGDTASADLLVRHGAQRLLVEVKSASGRASEKLVSALERHLQTWPALRPEAPVDGGVLVVNYQHKLQPHERVSEVFDRPEFVKTLPVRVVSSLQLFHWWREGDWQAIRDVFSAIAAQQDAQATTPAPAVPGDQSRAVGDQMGSQPRRSWSRLRRR